ncbi:Cupin 1 [Artemisia annua]|uniref:Germin-like protein n=1 Tax=Artemisia annua TaxID=35608 RepID=A0A2U1LDH1_ARTAN|nr:Cupin 1 [Artemisia annua]PWA47029.1 Cupin 1 [Artemisia annua]
MARVLGSFALLALVFCVAVAADDSPLQDFCVADMNGHVLVNGYTCKNPSWVQAEDFYYGGLHMMGNTSNSLGSKVTPVFVTQVPGLNTLGISLARIDYAPWGVNPPHTHPRASEILTLLEGSLEVGFITSGPENRHISKVLYKGDVFVFPENLIHYQKNNGNTNAIAIAALSSQNPGVISMASGVFGAIPEIPVDILAKGYKINGDAVSNIQHKF